MDFHFGATPESNAFFDGHPEIYPALERLRVLSNRAFGREYKFADRTEQIGFSLGETCRVDFLEILFLAVHGYGIGASKLLRGLYERAVALAYIIKHPDKAERFFRYGAIQEYKVMIPALELFTEDEFDRVIAPKTTVAEIRKAHEMVKPEFQVEVCEKCHHTGTAFSWDKKDVLAQVHDIGGAYRNFYLGAYAMANMHIHASLASAFQEYDKNPEKDRIEQRRLEADFALTNAWAVFLLVIRSQSTLFSLGLEAEIDACEQEWAVVWG